jgi:hypothetical protein
MVTWTHIAHREPTMQLDGYWPDWSTWPSAGAPDVYEDGTWCDRHGARRIPQGGYPRPVLADRCVMRLPHRVRVLGSI